jgi:hypothetical protein
MQSKIGVTIRVTCWGNILSLKNPVTKEKKKILILDKDRQSFMIPEGWILYYESHLVGIKSQYPKLQALIGDKSFIELPEKRSLWYD